MGSARSAQSIKHQQVRPIALLNFLPVSEIQPKICSHPSGGVVIASAKLRTVTLISHVPPPQSDLTPGSLSKIPDQSFHVARLPPLLSLYPADSPPRPLEPGLVVTCDNRTNIIYVAENIRRNGYQDASVIWSISGMTSDSNGIHNEPVVALLAGTVHNVHSQEKLNHCESQDGPFENCVLCSIVSITHQPGSDFIYVIDVCRFTYRSIRALNLSTRTITTCTCTALLTSERPRCMRFATTADAVILVESTIKWPLETTCYRVKPKVCPDSKHYDIRHDNQTHELKAVSQIDTLFLFGVVPIFTYTNAPLVAQINDFCIDQADGMVCVIHSSKRLMFVTHLGELIESKEDAIDDRDLTNPVTCLADGRLVIVGKQSAWRGSDSWFISEIRTPWADKYRAIANKSRQVLLKYLYPSVASLCVSYLPYGRTV